MLPPEMPITIFDRMFCANLELLRKYRISDELTLFHASYDYVVIYGRWLTIHYWSFHRDEAYLLARAILRMLYEDEPNRFKEHEFDWLAGFDLISYEQESGTFDGTAWFGQRTDRRYRIGEQKVLLVGEFSRGGRFRITEPNGFKAGEDAPAPRTVTLTPRDAELTARTILALLDDNREHEIAE